MSVEEAAGYTMGTVVLLCGDFDLSSVSHEVLVCLDPIRKRQVERSGRPVIALFDFTPSETEGRALDRELWNTLDQCLHQETMENPDLKWAPLAFQQVAWRLMRYMWLKDCIKRFLAEYPTSHLIVTSKSDGDLCLALEELSQQYCFRLEFHDGSLDQTSSLSYMAIPHGIPRKYSPLWCVNLYGGIVRASYGKEHPHAEMAYHLTSTPKSVVPFKKRATINLLSAFFEKFGFWEVKRLDLIDFVLMFNLGIEMKLKSKGWDLVFSSTEKKIINLLLTRYFDIYSNDYLDQICIRFQSYLRLTRPSCIVLEHDRTDYARLVTFAAHKEKIITAYFPHGLIFEDYSEKVLANSFFYQDLVFAWNEQSALAFRALNWSAATTCFGRVSFDAAEFRPLIGLPCRVLVLLSEWVGITRSGREDCYVDDLLKIVDACQRAKVPSSAISLKFHPVLPSFQVLKREILEKIAFQEILDFNIVDPATALDSILSSYDLIISSFTTGIVEVIHKGIPVIVFSHLYKRANLFGDVAIPHAKTPDELCGLISAYPNDSAVVAYEKLMSSLQEPPALDVAVSKVLFG